MTNQNEKLDINTAEGWSKYAEITNRKSFINEFGREPRDNAEVTEWVNAVVAEANRLYPTDDKQPDPQLRNIGGELFWVTNF